MRVSTGQEYVHTFNYRQAPTACKHKASIALLLQLVS